MRPPPILPILLFLAAALAGCANPPAAPTGGEPEVPGTLLPSDLAILQTPHSSFDKILCTPECLRRLTTPNTGPANEVMVAMDATNPKHLLAASKDYGTDNRNCVTISVSASADGGRTWSDGYLRPRTGAGGAAPSDRCESDPVAAFDGRGNGFVFSLELNEGIHTYRTSDLGKTWKEVGMAFHGRNDKNWETTDYRTHRLWSITRQTCDGGQAVTYSDDAGETWQGPFCFKGLDFAQIDVAPDGTLHAIGERANQILFSQSPDGRNWTPARPIATERDTVAHRYRTPVTVDMAVALGTGAVYAVWHDAIEDHQEVFFMASFDGGRTWGKPVRVNDDAGIRPSDQFLPAVAASPLGDAHVVFFDSRNDPTGDGHLLDVYYAHSPDGRTFDKNLRLTPNSFLPYLSKHQQQLFFVGDYIGVAASNQEAVAAFPVTYNGRAEIHSAIVSG